MMVSSATAVLPVWRSPMISSRWPRPIGIMASIALMPVWTGEFTGERSSTRGAMTSTGRVGIEDGRGPLPSSGSPSGFTTRPTSSGPTGTGRDAAGTSDLVAFLNFGVGPDDHDADGFLFEVQGDAHDVLLGELDELERPDVAETVYASNPVAHLDNRADLTRFDGRTEVRDLLDDKDGRLISSGWRCHIVFPVLSFRGTWSWPTLPPGTAASARCARAHCRQ